MDLKSAMKRFLNIKKKEKVLIITDRKRLRIAKKIYNACKQLAHSDLLIKPVGKRHGEEPNKRIAATMLKYDVIIAPTTHSLTHTNARRNACKKGARVATIPSATEEMYETLSENPFFMHKIGTKIKNFLRGKDFVRIITPSGTNVSFSIKNRIIWIDDGLIRKKGAFGNLPAGEASLAPLEGTANGIIVIDSQRDGKKVYAPEGTLITLKNGQATSISDEKCRLAKIFKTIKNSTNLVEWGIGINRKATFIGNILQDEKLPETVHLAFGNNKSFGGKVYSNVHLDAILFKPTVYVDGKRFMKKGKFV